MNTKNMTDEAVIIIDKVELRASVLTFRSDGIMHIHYKAVDEFAVDDLMDIINGLYRIGKGKKFLNLMTFEKFFIVEKEVRSVAATEIGSKYSAADAIVVKSTALKLLVNLYIAFNKPNRPTRMFDLEDKAVEWLRTFL